MVTTPPQQFCVRWNSYQSNLQSAFPKLLTSEHFVDVTLACESEMLKCHKVVLSACSAYFEKLLLDNPCQHPIIFMKDMKFSEMQSLVDFMYKGEVNVTQDDLPSLLKSAEALQIRGLCGSDQLLNPAYFNTMKQQNSQHAPQAHSTPKPSNVHHQQETKPQPSQIPMTNPMTKIPDIPIKKEQNQVPEVSDSGNNPSSSDCDSNDGMLHIKEDVDDEPEDSTFFDGDSELKDMMDQEMTEEDGPVNTEAALSPGPIDIKPQFAAIANVSCHYDATTASANRRIRRSDEELRRAAECITRGQTFQTVSDQFNIPISTIRFYMARKGILPRRKRGRACAGGSMSLSGLNLSHSPGAGLGGLGSMSGGAAQMYASPASPIGPPYHIVHYKLPALGVSKLK